MISKRGRYPHVAKTVFILLLRCSKRITYHTPSHATELHTGEIPNPLEYWGKIAKQFLVV